MKEVKYRPERVMVSLTPTAHANLKRLLLALEKEIERNPSAHPGYADRRLTFSDVINLINEGTPHA